MPLLWSLSGMLLNLVASMVGRALLTMGIGYVTYKGFDVGIQMLLLLVKTNVSGLPAQIIEFLAFLWVDKAISMIFSAYSAAASIRMLGSTSFTEMVTKG